MESLSISVPVWMDILSFPILMGILLTLDYCAAIWLQPTNIPSQIRGPAKTPEIFKFLVVFSLIGLATGYGTASLGMSLSRTVLAGFLLFAFFVWAFLTKKLWLVSCVCYGAAFVIGQVLVNYNALYAFLMTIIMVVIILIMAITIGPLNAIKTK